MARKVGPTFWPLLWEGFVKAWGWPATAIGLIATLALWIFTPTTTVNLFWLVGMAIAALIVLSSLFHAYYLAHLSLAPELPKVISGRPPHAPYMECCAVVMLESSELFGNDTSVSFYIVQDDGYEQFLAREGLSTSKLTADSKSLLK